MTDLDLLMEKLRQHLFGSGEFTKDDLWLLYNVVQYYKEQATEHAYNRGYDEGFEDGWKHGCSGEED